MKKLTTEQHQKIRSWVYRNARPLDLARYQYHFENGTIENVLASLSAYQNKDGGFGHGIEADFVNPNSSPVGVRVFFDILREIDFYDANCPLIMSAFEYLDNCEYYGNWGWHGVIPSNNEYLHAQWWHFDSNPWQLCPTGTLAGYSIRAADKETSIYKKSLQLINESLDALYRNLPDRVLSTNSYAHLLSDLQKSDISSQFDIGKIQAILKHFIPTEIEHNSCKWVEYTDRPSNYVTSPDNSFYPVVDEVLEKEIEFILETINSDGVWNIYWGYPNNRDFAVCENWWKSDIAIKRLLLLNAFGRVECSK